MGQISSQILQSRSIYINNWLPLQNQPNIFINKVTLQHVQRHSLQIPSSEISKQIPLYNNRINNNQPYICNILYYHPVSTQNTRRIQSNQQRQYHFYTDKLFPIKQWNYDNIIMILHGFRKLFLMYGPFQINQKMIAQNFNGEIKVWINQNPISNQPYKRYSNQEDTANDLIKILLKKNYSIGKVLQNSNNIREIIQKLNKQRRDSQTKKLNPAYHNFFKSPEPHNSLTPKQRIISISSYKNPFLETQDSAGLLKHKQQSSTSQPINIPIKPFQRNLYTPLSKRPQIQKKPTSKNNNLTEYMRYQKSQGQLKPTSKTNNKIQHLKYDPNFIKYQSQQLKNPPPPPPAFNKSKSNNQIFLQFTKNKQINPQNRSNYSSLKNQLIQNNQNDKITQLKIKYPSNLSGNKQIINLGASPKKQYKFKPPTQQKYKYKPYFINNNHKNKETLDNNNIKQQAKITQPNFFKQNSPQKYKLPYKSKKTQQQKTYKGQNITIINNNVNNYVNNITHNHIVKFQKNNQPVQSYQFKSSTSSNQNNSQTNSPILSNQTSQNNKGYKYKTYVPGFINQKKVDNLLVQQNQNNLSHKPKSFCQPQIIDGNRFQKQHSITGSNFNKSYQKIQNKSNIHANINHSKSYKDSIYYKKDAPSTPQFDNRHQNTQFGTIQSNYNDLFVPFRTKTTQFYHKNRDFNKKSQFGKSFTGEQIQKNQQKQIFYDKIQLDINKSSQSQKKQYVKQQLKADMKNLLKNQQIGQQSKKKLNSQLKNQFKFLLSDNNITQKTQMTINIKSENLSPINKGQQIVEVKDKIKNKQNIFAQLKKQANNLLG